MITEKLTTNSEAVNHKHPSRKRRGYFISKSAVVAMAFVYLLSVLVTGMSVFQWLNPSPAVESSIITAVTSTPQPYTSNGRLPTHVTPSTYRLNLIPFLTEGNFTAHGEVWIDLNCSQGADNITLNINDIIIIEEEVRVVDLDANTDMIIVGHEYDKESEMYSVRLAEELQEGRRYQFYIKFIVHLNDLLQGFYRSSYIHPRDNQTSWLATTQFSPTDARRAFPCFDEPAFKAEFQISIAHPSNLISLSNMPLNDTEPIEGMPDWWWDHYPPTLPMSTYLVAFMVFDFQGVTASIRKSAVADNLVTFGMWSRPDAIKQTRYAGFIGPQILYYLETYFGVPFPLPKQDMVALPDFGFNAMENWGLITYRETALLYDEEVSTLGNKENVARVVGHELAHQWFGNLVTPMWWNDLWLKEGFATYIGNIGVVHVEPGWKEDERFITKIVQNVFYTDSLHSSHPISVPVDHPNQIRQMFDGISYNKGASIIRMMSHFLGEETFRAGLKNYLQIHKYGNARQEDLWSVLTSQAHQDGVLPPHITVENIMDTWTLQTGYPVVSVIRDYDKQSAVVTQDRFLLFNSFNNTSTKSSPSWWVPLTFTTQKDPDFNTTIPELWLENTPSMEIEGLPEEDSWVIFNIQLAGYYRVNYDPLNWELLTEDYHSLPAIARAQLLDDAFNLARAGRLDYSLALNLASQLRNDMDYLPWASALPGLSYLTEMLALTPAYGNFKAYVLELTNELYKKLEFQDKPTDTHLERMHRVIVLQLACEHGHEQCIWNARSKFRVWMSQDSRGIKSNPISPDLKSVVYCTAIRHGGSDEWDFAWSKYLSANVASERETLLDALGCSSQPWLLNRYLNWMLSNDSGIRKQDGFRVFVSVSNNVMGNSLAFNFLRSNWEDILDYFGLAFSSVSKMVDALPKYMNTQLQLNELDMFQTENTGNLATAEQSLKQTREKVEANVHWMTNSYKQVQDWLRRRSGTSRVSRYF